MHSAGFHEEFARQREIEAKRLARSSVPREAALARRAAHWDQPITIRPVAVRDRPGLERLAERSKARVPDEPSLIADVGGRPIAALALGDGSLLVDRQPGAAQIAALLRLRARQLSGQRHGLGSLIAVAHRRAARLRP